MKMEFEVIERYRINLMDHDEFEWDIYDCLNYDEMKQKIKVYISDYEWLPKIDLYNSILIFKNLYIEQNKSYLETIEKCNVEKIIKQISDIS